jgi:hypothetical protein
LLTDCGTFAKLCVSNLLSLLLLHRMTPQPPTPPPTPPKTLIGVLTQAVQTVQARVDFSKLALKPNAKVPELWVQDADADKADIYPLLGDRYVVGRSSKSSDIVVRNPVVSQIHLSLTRDSQRPGTFILKDENSTNGVYRGKRRLDRLPLRHGDVLTLGPPELAAAVRVQYVYPPPWYVQGAKYGLYGFTGLTAIAGLWVGIQWQRFSVRPLPLSVQGPVVVTARDNQTLLRSNNSRTHQEIEQLQEFSPYLPNAVIASEDSRYYWHLGVDPIGILRAIVTNLRGGVSVKAAVPLRSSSLAAFFGNMSGQKIRQAANCAKPSPRLNWKPFTAKMTYCSTTSTASISATVPMALRMQPNSISANLRAI